MILGSQQLSLTRRFTFGILLQLSTLLFCSWLLIPVALVRGDLLASYLYHFCEGGNFTSRSQYQINVNLLLFQNFPGTGSAKLFHNASQGEYPDQIHGLFSCRGDISTADCKSCVFEAAQEILIRRCPRRQGAMIWFEGCFVRYANTSFISTMDPEPAHYIWDTRNVTEPWNTFDLAATNMLRNLTIQATSNPSHQNYGATEVRVSNSLRLYGLVQCTRDISGSECRSCLEILLRSMFSSVRGNQGGRFLSPSCNLRYDIFSFTNRNAPSPGKVNKGRTIKIAVGVSVLVALLLVLSVAYILYLKRRKRIKEGEIIYTRKGTVQDNLHESLSSETQGKGQELPLMNFQFISTATRQFANENKLGEGGFGPVYKGTLPNGQEIAVKRHTRTSGQGLEEYRNEVALIANLQHRNLVKLQGCCLEEHELLLIYEYMPNKSLDVILFDPSNNKKLDWRTRFSIINGIARGILYLHEDSRLRIVHRDLKASNVLLDHDMNPKISDFGMARIFHNNQNAANTNRVVGTYGYMAPEYAMHGVFSVKSDVYSFGILLLEIICGKKNSSFNTSGQSMGLVSHAWTMWSEFENPGHGFQLMDPSLEKSYILSEVLKCIHIALLCVQDDPDDRPTMSSVVLMLGSETVSLRQPTQPTFSLNRFIESRVEATPDRLSTSINNVTVSQISPR